jgi:hypothetical protein
MIKKLIDTLSEYWKAVMVISTICTTIFTWALLSVNTIKDRAVNEFVREQDEIRKDTTINFLSRGFVQINSRLENIEGMMRMSNEVAETHTLELKNVRSSLTKHYLMDKSLTKKDLLEALEELDAKKKDYSGLRIP